MEECVGILIVFSYILQCVWRVPKTRFSNLRWIVAPPLHLSFLFKLWLVFGVRRRGIQRVGLYIKSRPVYCVRANSRVMSGRRKLSS